MPGPTKQADVVLINETYGTPDNFNKAHEHDTLPTYDEQGRLTQLDVVQGGVLRHRTILAYTDGLLTSTTEKIYELDGFTVAREYVDTISYSNGVFAGITRTVV